MKKILYLTIVFFTVLQTNTVNSQHINEFLMFPPGGFDDIPPPGPPSVPSEMGDFAFNNGYIDSQSFFNLVSINNLLLEQAMLESYANAWYTKQQNIIKQQIESKLNKTFSNFNEAKNALFLQSEQANISRNKIPLKNKYTTLESTGFSQQTDYLKSIKLLQARQVEISTGNINNSQYGYLTVNGILLKDITNNNTILQQLDIQNSLFEINSETTHNSKYINLKLSNLGVELENYILVLKNNYYNSFERWDQLNLMQLLLNYEQFKKYNQPPYAIPPLLQKFTQIDQAKKSVIENYAISHRSGGFSVFSNDHFLELLDQARLQSNMYVDYSDMYASVSSDWEWEKEIAKNNLLNVTNISDLNIVNIINNISNPINKYPIEFYLLMNYRHNNLLDLSAYGVAGSSINIGDYTLTPHFDKNNVLIYYAAARQNGKNLGIEYIIKANALSDFQNNISIYTHAANLFYLGGKPTQSQIAMAAGDYWSGLKGMWVEAVHSPEWWAYVITSFGHAIVNLPGQTIVSSTQATPNWSLSLKRMVSSSFKGKTVTNPQGIRIVIDIPDNYVPSIANNGKGINFRPLGSNSDANLIRVMQPTIQNPKGYVVYYNSLGQPFNPLNGQTLSTANWHFGF